MSGGVHNSVDTVNAAATAIVTAESRVQPSTVQKSRWGSCWSLNWCFGSCKNNKRIGHAVLVSEPAVQASIAPVVENRTNSSTAIVLPFIAPPSSPASFLPADAPSSATQSPKADVLSLASLSVHAYPPSRTAPKFTIGPYAYETQLVSPPVFSTFTTEPSTANFTPPPEPVQMTTPSSPEVPFAELLSSSLARSGRRSEKDLKYSFSQYEFQPYQYPGSPGGNTKSPGSAISTSGTSSPFPDKVPKFIGYEHFTNYKWGSGVGSGSLTPNGWTGASTPNGGVSRLGSGTMTPNGWTGASTPNGGISGRGSGTLTANGGGYLPRDRNHPENQVPELASLPKSDHELLVDDIIVDHRVSFELIGEDIPICIVREPVPSNELGNLREAIGKGTNEENVATEKIDSFGKWRSSENVNEIYGTELDEEREEFQKNRTISLGSSKDFNFNNAKGEVSDKSAIDCEWWTTEKVVDKESGHQDSWTFFPMLQPGVS